MFRGLSKMKSERPEAQGSSPPRRTSANKSELAITTPKRIIQALYPYTAEHDDELSFEQNSFFYVNEDISGGWYLAFDPLRNVKGLVPQSYFEVIQRHEQQPVSMTQARKAHSRSGSNTSFGSASSTRFTNAATSRQSAGSTYSHRKTPSVSTGLAPGGPEIITRSKHGPSASAGSTGSAGRRPALRIYGLVLYDFQAERNDELTVTAGESIVIVAQSTEEWFVAKPIGRLGGPGLIPVSYVELREVGTDAVLTDVNNAIHRANLPQVEEWKRRLAEYKASSIPLGHSASSSQSNVHSRSASTALSERSSRSGKTGNIDSAVANGQHYSEGPQNQASQHHEAGQDQPGQARGAPSSQRVFVVSASVDRFAVNGGRYWYLVKIELSNGVHRNLCRFYQDFYDFQILLLDQFPEEAGRTGKARTLPFMPGPLTLVSHSASSQRRANLDDYVRDLIRMPPHISQSATVLDLFSVRPGDVESREATQQLPQPPESAANEQYSGDMEYNQAVQTGSPPSGVAMSSPTATPATNHPTGSAPIAQTTNQSLSSPTRAYGSPPRTSPPRTSPPRISPQRMRPNHEASASMSSLDTRMYPAATRSDVRLDQPALKIKIFKTDNVIALRVPTEMPFSEIYDRIATRIGVAQPQLYSNAYYTGGPIRNESDFARVVAGETKVSLFLKS